MQLKIVKPGKFLQKTAKFTKISVNVDTYSFNNVKFTKFFTNNSKFTKNTELEIARQKVDLQKAEPTFYMNPENFTLPLEATVTFKMSFFLNKNPISPALESESVKHSTS